jgi:hypothetical protein
MPSPRTLKIIGIVFVVGFIALCVYLLIPKTYIIFATAPGEITVVINGKPAQQVKNKDQIMVGEGHYKITASRSEFDSYTAEFDVKSGSTAEFLVALNPQTDAARQLLLDSASQSVIQRFHGNRLTSETQKITDTNPIVSVLPISARLYTVYACPSVKFVGDSTKIAVCVDLYQDGLVPYVIKDLASRGFKADALEMIYINKF